MEDKQVICDMLLETLRRTRNFSDLIELAYDGEAEIVRAIFASGGEKIVNVAMDSGVAMIKDIMRALA